MKGELRLLWKEKRLQIPPERRKEASLALSNYTFPTGIIASFASFKDEVDTHPLNKILAQKELLVLPRVENDHLVFYHVSHSENELAPSSWGILEPIPSLCKVAHQIDVILVPGLAFDTHNHRLGYGKGHYDKALANTSAIKIGIGFKEQLADRLPKQPHDIQLDQVVLL
jgi:5-formyltetrahydrofolate cyclo-ligase